MKKLVNLGAGIAAISAFVCLVSKVLSILSQTFGIPFAGQSIPAEAGLSGPPPTVITPTV